MKQRTLATLAVGILLVISMLGLRHVDKLNDGIKLKEIEIKDNSLRLELLDKKYLDLNGQLKAKDADKQKLEQELQKLQQERLELEKALQAKKQQKANDLAVKAQKAVTGTQVASAAVPTGCGDAKSCIYAKESGNRTDAINASSGACGLGQAWPCIKMGCSLQDYACQDAYFTRYALVRYGGWEQAWAYWQAHHWW